MQSNIFPQRSELSCIHVEYFRLHRNQEKQRHNYMRDILNHGGRVWRNKGTLYELQSKIWLFCSSVIATCTLKSDGLACEVSSLKSAI